MEINYTNAPIPSTAEAHCEADAITPVWRVLIVDREPHGHKAATLTLGHVVILGRELEYLHAYSISAAEDILLHEVGIAVILLDVGIENGQSGFSLVETIRGKMNLRDVRIILRTSDSAFLPELQILHDFDINDYQLKAAQTRSSLYASITSAIRSYAHIDELRRTAFVDPLCLLPNRAGFLAMIDAQIADALAPTSVVAILDIDDFSEVNDALGHSHGDCLLQKIGLRLSTCLPKDLFIARVGSNAFGLLGPEHSINTRQLRDLFKSPFLVLDDVLTVISTIGIVRLSDTSGSSQEVFMNAHLALKRAKRVRRGSCFTYTRKMGDEVRSRIQMQQDLRLAVNLKQLYVVYQPQVNLNDGQVVGMEALVRWKRSDGHYVSPEKFIPLAEASGLIFTIGDMVLRTACRDMMRMRAMGLPNWRMSINVSQIQFRHPGLISELISALEESGADPRDIELEITESIAMEDPEFMKRTLATIKELGFSIAIDDFGTGYSSLRYLLQLDVDRLKIDREFVREIHQNLSGRHIAAMVVDLGRSLNLTLIAEGIEEEAQADVLRTMGCQEGQGYLYAAPMSFDDVTLWASRLPALALCPTVYDSPQNARQAA